MCALRPSMWLVSVSVNTHHKRIRTMQVFTWIKQRRYYHFNGYCVPHYYREMFNWTVCCVRFASVAGSMSLQCDHIRYRLIAFYKSIFPKKNIASARFTNKQWCTEMSSNGNVVVFPPLAMPPSGEEIEKCQNELHDRHQQEQPSKAKKRENCINSTMLSFLQMPDILMRMHKLEWSAQMRQGMRLRYDAAARRWETNYTNKMQAENNDIKAK